MQRGSAGAGRGSWLLAGLLTLVGGCTTVDPPVNVAAGMFFNELCAQSHVIYQVPADRLLVIDDASAEAFDSATANTPGNPGIVDNVFTELSLRTNPSTVNFGSADHVIVAGRSPVAGPCRPTPHRGPRSSTSSAAAPCRSTPECGSPAA